MRAFLALVVILRALRPRGESFLHRHNSSPFEHWLRAYQPCPCVTFSAWTHWGDDHHKWERPIG